MDSITLQLIIVVLLIILTAFFVSSEFAVVKIRESRIDQLIEEGSKRAVIAKKLIENLDYYLSACQLGITVTALGLGWLGEPAVKRLLDPLFVNMNIAPTAATTISFTLAFTLITYLHVVVGELAPKTLAIQYAEKIVLMLATPLYWFGKVMAPLIWTMNGSARLILKMFGIKPVTEERALSEEELKIIMTQSYNSGEINKTELNFLENIFTFDERVAKDVMVPRIQVVTLDLAMSREEIIEIIKKYQYTRYPVTKDGDKDNIIGFVNLKRMFTDYVKGKEPKLEEIVQELPLILENTRIKDALLKMRMERVHMALVLDEYGGTSGIITMEDILEEIVGEIRDEFDTDEIPDIVEKGDGLYYINGRMLLSELEKRFNMTFDDSDEVDTIGGWIQLHNMDILPNDSIEHDDHVWTVLEMDNHQIKQVALQFRNRDRDDRLGVQEG